MGNSILPGRRIRENRVNSLNSASGAAYEEVPIPAAAQSPLHAPVNELHSIDFKAHTNLFFSLT